MLVIEFYEHCCNHQILAAFVVILLQSTQFQKVCVCVRASYLMITESIMFLPTVNMRASSCRHHRVPMYAHSNSRSVVFGATQHPKGAITFGSGLPLIRVLSVTKERANNEGVLIFNTLITSKNFMLHIYSMCLPSSVSFRFLLPLSLTEFFFFFTFPFPLLC